MGTAEDAENESGEKMVDYPSAVDMSLPTNYSFDSCAPLSIVVHETGGDMTLDAVHNTFLATERSTHFAIDQSGNVAQFVPLDRGAGGNCCPDKDANGNLLCDPYWFGYVQQYGNLNLCTISIEHCNNSTNSLPMSQAQTDASNKLILWLCQKFNLNINHIKGHNSINPKSKPDCPGTFNFSQLAAYLQGGSMGIPYGWHDANNVLTAPNGVVVVLGFREYVLGHNWDAGNWPLTVERYVDLLEASNPSLGGGDQQIFRWSMLGYSAQRGVFMEWLGVELATVRQQAITYHDLSKQLQAEIDSLKQQLAAAQQPTGVDPKTVAERLTAIGLAMSTGNAAVQQLVTQPL